MSGRVAREGLSPKNPEIARLRGLARQRRARREAGRFIVEGAKLVVEALESPLVVHQVLHPVGVQLGAGVAERLDGLELLAVSERAFERIATTESPQPVLAEVELPEADWGALVQARRVLVAVDINDPGNVGTLARAAEAAGFDALVVLGATADPYGPKAVRAGAGALFRLSVISGEDPAEGLARVGTVGLVRFGTRMADAMACDRVDFGERVALVLGSEAHGLDPALAGQIDEWVTIPMAGPTESLNVAMAGAILAYEISRR